MQKSMNNNYSKKSDVRFAFCNSEENPITTAHCLNWNDSRIKANTWRHIIFINPQSHITGYFYKRLLVYFTHKNMHGNEYEKVECHIKLNVREWEIDEVNKWAVDWSINHTADFWLFHTCLITCYGWWNEMAYGIVINI